VKVARSDVDEITTLAELEALREPWQKLLQRCEYASAFQTPAWILTWCRRFRCESIWAPVVRERDRLLAFAPWLIYSEGGRRVVAFMAGGVSDYHDVLVDPVFSSELGPVLFDWLAERRELWDICDFEALPPGAAWRSAAPSAPGSESVWSESATEEEACPRLRLAVARELSDVVPGRHLARYREYRRRAERRAVLELDVAPPSDWERALGDVLRLHRARAQMRGRPSALAGETLAAFHDDVARELAHAGALRIYRLKWGGAIAAAIHGFIFRRTLALYMQGLDPTFAHASPGTILLGMLLEHALGEGIETVDFLRGDEPYKLAWGASGPRNLRRRFAR
jgi:CelD/BcsL family acetyltransferase involved in cellulose biosynthesis